MIADGCTVILFRSDVENLNGLLRYAGFRSLRIEFFGGALVRVYLTARHVTYLRGRDRDTQDWAVVDIDDSVTVMYARGEGHLLTCVTRGTTR
jgi:hypothetical protein